MKKITLLLLMIGFSSFVSAQCLDGNFGQFPSGTFTPTTCDGLTLNEITNDGYAGEYTVVSVTAGQTYTFTSSVSTDYLTLSSDGGLTADAFGTTPLTWVATVDGEINVYTNTDDTCGDEDLGRIKSVICGIPSADAPDYANLQWPPTATIDQGGSVDVYGQVYEAGLTDVAPNVDGQAPGIQMWVGISPEGDNSNPNTWINWTAATFNAGQVSNNDEYMASIGADLSPGTYYYATRFRLNTGIYVYGGTNGTNGNFWDGIAFNSGVLTVSPPPPPVNDDISGAIELTLDLGTDCGPNKLTNLGNLGSTPSLEVDPTCIDQYNPSVGNGDVWFKFVAPAPDVTLNISDIGGEIFTMSSILYSGTSGNLTEIGDCGNASTKMYTGLTVGDTYYFRTWDYGNDDIGTFSLCGYYLDCTNATVTYSTSADCANSQFSVAVNITDLGSATSLTISDDQGNTMPATAAGIVTMGPYAFGTSVIYTIANDQNAACSITSPAQTLGSCPPTNDECANAIQITCGDNLTGQTTEGATGGTSTSCVGTIGNDIWYKFSGNGQNIILTATVTNDEGAQVEVYESTDGTCSGFTPGDCFASAGTGDLVTTLNFVSVTGMEYYIHIGSWINGDPATNFDLSVTCQDVPASVPDCASNPSPADGATGVTTGDVVFTWTAPTTGGPVDSYDFYGGTTTPLTDADFIGNFTTTSADITITGYDLLLYWKIVPKNLAGDAVGCTEWSFTTESAPAAPANDACSTATAITSLPYTFDQNDGGGATNNDGFITSCADSMNDGVWYTVVGDTGDITIDITPDSTFDPQIGVYTGTCGAFTCVGTADDGFAAGDPESYTITASEAGTTYYINIGNYSGVTDNLEGKFTIDVTSTFLANPVFDKSGFTAYPNPVKDILNLSYSKAITSVAVFNLLGQQVMTKSVNANQSQIDMSNLSSGTYLVKVTSDEAIKTIKVVKE